ncbi:MAG TPA: glutamate--tRNA ligase [Candidatus Brocadiia bacterium]|nr:glutamate--tRNA ligase [Candidatus Brocadiia bacterium]
MSQTCVRFAPSPTGPAHVGNAYVALFDYAFSRATGGRFILRIEDTDRERSRREYEELLLRSMRWLGLNWDEGPDVGGPNGPYRQSERQAIYAAHAAQLVRNGRAYPCFCTAERLDALRQQQMAAKQSLGYDGACRGLSPDEARRRVAAGEPHVIRLAVPKDGQTAFTDLVRGEVVFQNSTIDDQVLLKTDGFPTYHLANVVDDHLMGVTHVCRAEEWISSTPKHILLYQAFGWTPPVFIHLPLLRNPDKSKLSKRKNPTSVDWYREQGFLPQAMINFLALMAFGMGKEKFTIEEFIAAFSWDKVGAGAPVFDIGKLEWLNGEYIRDMSPQDLAAALRQGFLGGRDIDDATLAKLIPLARERMKKLSDFAPLMEYIFADEVSPTAADLVPKKKTAAETAEVLRKTVNVLAAVAEWKFEPTEKACRDLCEQIGWKARDYFMPIRVAITGSQVSPPLFESMEIIGREKSLARIRKAIGLLDESKAG